jgi:hypothetical protein
VSRLYPASTSPAVEPNAIVGNRHFLAFIQQVPKAACRYRPVDRFLMGTSIANYLIYVDNEGSADPNDHIK